jgi:hypothetical protein
MTNSRRPTIRLVAALVALTFSSSACVSGGFRWTRSVARYVNSNSVLPRVLLWAAFVILPVYLLAFLFDVILWNTLDFWSGSVSAQNTTFEQDGAKIEVAHSANPLKKTVITVIAKDGKRTVSELRETERHSIEVLVDGVKKGEVESVTDAISSIALYRPDGGIESTQLLDNRVLDEELAQREDASSQHLPPPISLACAL